jgi:hypothetical protein
MGSDARRGRLSSALTGGAHADGPRLTELARRTRRKKAMMCGHQNRICFASELRGSVRSRRPRYRSDRQVPGVFAVRRRRCTRTVDRHGARHGLLASRYAPDRPRPEHEATNG